MKMSILSIATAVLLSMTACSNESSIDDTPRPASPETPAPSGNVATIYTTTGDGSQKLDKTASAIFNGTNMAPSTILVDPSQTYQTMDGFGFAITYSTCYNLLKMSAEDRSSFLRQTYSETEGYGVSYARISIGCNDFSSTEYSLCDEPGLENFRLYTDETQYVIPVLKEILAINPNVKIIAFEGLLIDFAKEQKASFVIRGLRAVTDFEYELQMSLTNRVLNPEIDENANADVSDVINYVRAINFAIRRLEDLPLCNRLIRETHEVLMHSVRGGDKTPGEFRRSQNWIGGVGSTLKNARYIPPNPSDMEACMSDLEKFMNDDDEMDPLIKAALLHYQFETIRPFLDGNGRVGRLLITLFLMEKQELSSPVLYLSCYLKSNRIEYYDRMSEVRKSGNFEQWIKFFLRGVAETAEDATETIDRLTALHRKTEAKLTDVPTRSRRNIMDLFAYIERNPIIETVKTAGALGLSRNGVANYIATFCSKDILRYSSKSGKALVFAYEEYLDILRKDT